MLEYVSCSRMEDGTREDWDLLFRLEQKVTSDVVDRIPGHLKLLDVDWGGYVIVPTAPGPGVELDEDVAAAHPYKGDERHLEMADHPII